MCTVPQIENGRTWDPVTLAGDSTPCLAQRGGQNKEKEQTDGIMAPKFLASIDSFGNPRVEKLKVGTTEQVVSYKY